MKRLCLLFAVLSLATVVAIGQPLDPAAISTAGVHDLGEKFPGALGSNPALLGREVPYRSSLEIFGGAFSVANNSVSTTFWNQNIAGDRFLTRGDVQNILSEIPSSGVRVHGRLSVPVVGFQYNKMAARVSVETAGHGRLPKDLVELALQGNQLGREYTLSHLRGESYSTIDYAVGFGHEFEQDKIPHLYAGAAFHFFQGVLLEKVADAGGSVLVTDSLIYGSAIVQAVESNSGDGVGFDLGGLAVFNEKIEAGLALRQLGSEISWLVKHNHVATFASDSAGIIVDSLENEDYVERAFEAEDTTFDGGTISTRLPAIVLLNAKYKWSKKLALLGEMQLVTAGAPLDDPSFSTGVAAHYYPLQWLTARGGLRVGGSEALSIGIGGALQFRRYELSAGWNWHGGLFNSAKGVGFGIVQRIKF